MSWARMSSPMYLSLGVTPVYSDFLQVLRFPSLTRSVEVRAFKCFKNFHWLLKSIKHFELQRPKNLSESQQSLIIILRKGPRN